MPPELTLLLAVFGPMTVTVGAFFKLGQLSQRVSTLERERNEEKTAANARANLAQADHDTLVRMSQTMENMEVAVEKVSMEMTSMQRQLATLASRGAGGITVLNQGGLPQ